FVRSEPLVFKLTIAEILKKHVGGRKQPMHGLAVLGYCKIEHDAALSPIEQRKERGAHAAEAARLVSGGRLDLDDLCSELGQNHAAGWAHHHMGHLYNPHPLQ